MSYIMKFSVVFVVFFSLACCAAAQQSTSTCKAWAEPKTYQNAIVAAPDPKKDRPAVIFGDTFTVPSMRVRFINASSGQPMASQDVAVNYGWRFLDYPYPEHAFGAWTETSDRLSCSTDEKGWIDAPQHLVKPRGWYRGIYTSLPWPKRPTFTGIELVAVTKAGFARVSVPPSEIQTFNRSVLIVRVFESWRTEMSWEKQPSTK